jgi:hypothetical protein
MGNHFASEIGQHRRHVTARWILFAHFDVLPGLARPGLFGD